MECGALVFFFSVPMNNWWGIIGYFFIQHDSSEVITRKFYLLNFIFLYYFPIFGIHLSLLID
jgi:hypothetical protein